jgi:class 3 adenylate cyclase
VPSEHLEGIVARHERVANVQVVFADVESYSKRRTQNQIAVIDAFAGCLRTALQSVATRYITYAQANNVNFATDLIKLPTGDGAAIAFSFDGLHDAHLTLATELLKEAHSRQAKDPCEKFLANSWCNCHPHFNLRIGISEGKGIIFRDINDGYNLAGSVINLASRVMSKMDRAQIAFTDIAYKQIIDMVEDPDLVDHFRGYAGVRIKHGDTITIYQYIDAAAQYLNSDEPSQLALDRELTGVVERMAGANIASLLGSGLSKSEERDRTRKAVQGMADVLDAITGRTSPDVPLIVETHRVEDEKQS